MNHNETGHDGGPAIGIGTEDIKDIEDIDAIEDIETSQHDDGGLVVAAVAGLAAMGVSMAARPVLNALYRRVTGNQPPTADDPLVPFGRALAWTVVSATTGAVLEMIVQRTTRRFFGVRA